MKSHPLSYVLTGDLICTYLLPGLLHRILCRCITKETRVYYNRMSIRNETSTIRDKLKEGGH